MKKLELREIADALGLFYFTLNNAIHSGGHPEIIKIKSMRSKVGGKYKYPPVCIPLFREYFNRMGITEKAVDKKRDVKTVQKSPEKKEQVIGPSEIGVLRVSAFTLSVLADTGLFALVLKRAARFRIGFVNEHSVRISSLEIELTLTIYKNQYFYYEIESEPLVDGEGNSIVCAGEFGEIHSVKELKTFFEKYLA